MCDYHTPMCYYANILGGYWWEKIALSSYVIFCFQLPQVFRSARCNPKNVGKMWIIIFEVDLRDLIIGKQFSVYFLQWAGTLFCQICWYKLIMYHGFLAPTLIIKSVKKQQFSIGGTSSKARGTRSSPTHPGYSCPSDYLRIHVCPM